MFRDKSFSISGILSVFLDRVCSGRDEFAEVHPSLEFLGFGFGVTSSSADIAATDNFIKSEPDNLSYLEPEAVFEPTPDDVDGDGDESFAVDRIDDSASGRTAAPRTRKRRQRYDVDDDDDDNDPDFLVEQKTDNDDK